MKTEAVRFPETSVNFYRTTRRHVPEDGTIHSYRGQNPKYKKVIKVTSTTVSSGM
jgi:hypothetical protein